MELEKISIDKIRMYENNTKEHPEWQVEKIVKSNREFSKIKIFRRRHGTC